MLAVHGIWVDCDADALLYLVEPQGPTCHTGRPSCFFRPLNAQTDGSGEVSEDGGARDYYLACSRAKYRSAKSGCVLSPETSYTRTLLDGGVALIGNKVNEEAAELVDALTDESADRVAAEAADLFYHAMVGLSARGLSLRDVAAVLSARFGVSGLAEKASREV